MKNRVNQSADAFVSERCKAVAMPRRRRHEDMTEEDRKTIKLAGMLRRNGFTAKETEEIIARMACGQTFDSAMQRIMERW